MSTELTYDDVARILAMLDMTKDEDLDVALGDIRIVVQSWGREAAVVAPEKTLAQAERGSDPRSAAGPPKPLADTVEIRAPRPGRYRALVEVDAAVREGEMLGEVVGLAGVGSEVLAPSGGRLVELCVCEGDFVEYRQVIAVIEQSTKQPDQLRSRPTSPLVSGQTA